MNITGLFYDSETTNLPLWKEPSDHPGQPHIVQLAAQRLNMITREVLAQMDVLVKPDGWAWDDSATSTDTAFLTHRITMERAMDEGIPEKDAIEMLLAMQDPNTMLVGFNEQFDRRICRIAIKRYLDPLAPGYKVNAEGYGEADPGIVLPSDLWKEAFGRCAMRMSHPLVKLPKNKLPKLTEAYEHLLGKPMEGAHNAMGDVDGTIAVYFHLEPSTPAATTPSGDDVVPA